MQQMGISEIFVKLNIELIRNVHFLKKHLHDARPLLSKKTAQPLGRGYMKLFVHLPVENSKSDFLEK